MREPELAEILRWHAARYPLLRPIDALKLLYQGEFGGGHLLADPERSRAGLLEECAHTEQEPDAPLFEPLGGDVVRLNLRALEANGISPEWVFEAFDASAERMRGDPECFSHKLDWLRTFTGAKAMPFTLAQLDDQLFSYAAQGFPPCSHSAEYRRAYRPAYRVLLRSMLDI